MVLCEFHQVLLIHKSIFWKTAHWYEGFFSQIYMERFCFDFSWTKWKSSKLKQFEKIECKTPYCIVSLIKTFLLFKCLVFKFPYLKSKWFLFKFHALYRFLQTLWMLSIHNFELWFNSHKSFYILIISTQDLRFLQFCSSVSGDICWYMLKESSHGDFKNSLLKWLGNSYHEKETEKQVF